MFSAVVSSKAVLLLLFIYCLLLLSLFLRVLFIVFFGVLCCSLFCHAVLNTVPWFGLQYVIVTFPAHTHLLLIATFYISKLSTQVCLHSQLGSRKFAQDSRIQVCLHSQLGSRNFAQDSKFINDCNNMKT